MEFLRIASASASGNRAGVALHKTSGEMDNFTSKGALLAETYYFLNGLLENDVPAIECCASSF